MERITRRELFRRAAKIGVRTAVSLPLAHPIIESAMLRSRSEMWWWLDDVWHFFFR